MKGLDRFETARREGRLLSRQVLLWIGRDGADWWKWRELFVLASGRVDSPKEDMRVMVGLDVTLVADRYDDTAAAIFAKLKKYAASIVFVILSADDGLVWVKGQEVREL